MQDLDGAFGQPSEPPAFIKKRTAACHDGGLDPRQAEGRGHGEVRNTAVRSAQAARPNARLPARHLTRRAQTPHSERGEGGERRSDKHSHGCIMVSFVLCLDVPIILNIKIQLLILGNVLQ